MGRVFTLLVLTVALFGATARAYEFGTEKDRAAVRWDTERLLARTVAERKKTPRDLVITDVITDGDWALAVYHIGDYRGFMTLHKVWSQWWDMADGSLSGDWCTIVRATAPLKAKPAYSYAPGMTDECLREGGLPSALLAAAANTTEGRTTQTEVETYGRTHENRSPLQTRGGELICTVCGERLGATSGTISDPYAMSTGGYITSLSYGQLKKQQSVTVSHFYGRAPTENESTQRPNGDAFYFFTLELSGTNAVTFPQGTTLDVWFPHVLFPNLRYRITAGWGTKSLGPIQGTLLNNALHFVLPQFTLAPAESMMYEIDGDP